MEPRISVPSSLMCEHFTLYLSTHPPVTCLSVYLVLRVHCGPDCSVVPNPSVYMSQNQEWLHNHGAFLKSEIRTFTWIEYCYVIYRPIQILPIVSLTSFITKDKQFFFLVRDPVQRNMWDLAVMPPLATLICSSTFLCLS